MNRRILIIAYECFPYNRPGAAIGSQRPYNFANHFASLGWKTVVLCRHYQNNDIHKSAKQTIQEFAEKIKSIDFTKPNVTIPIADCSPDRLIDRLWNNTVRRVPETGGYVAKSGLANQLVRKFTSFIKIFSGDYSSSWKSVCVHAGEHLIRQLNFDIIIGCHSPDAGLHAARELHQKTGVPYIIDFRDPLLQPVHKFARPLARFYYRRLLRQARFLVNVNPFWVETDAKDFRRPCVMITNGYNEEETPSTHVARSSCFTITFYGNISFPGSLRLLFEGLRTFNNEAHEWQLHYFGNLSHEIEKLSVEFGLEHRVVVKSQVSRAELFANITVPSVFILFSLDPTKTNDPYLSMGYYPGKVFEYFNLSMPFLLIPGDNAMLSSLVSQSGLGIPCDNEKEISDALMKLYAEYKTSMNFSLRPNQPFISQFSRFNQAKLLLDQINLSLTCVE